MLQFKKLSSKISSQRQHTLFPLVGLMAPPCQMGELNNLFCGSYFIQFIAQFSILLCL